MAIDTTIMGEKNLLAYSAGIDSSALFYLLIEHGVKFDIAIVNYQTRDASDIEEHHAIEIARRYGIECYHTRAPEFDTHFERNAREFRYQFFEDIIQKHSYDTLITAHQLNDQLEWMLMRLTKGAGVSELVGLKTISQRAGYTLIRPLLSYAKHELLEYLQSNEYSYFIDESNSDQKYERNRFRSRFADPLMEKYTDGIRRSFEYMTQDKRELESRFETVYSSHELRVIRLQSRLYKTKATDLILKELGYLMSGAQRSEVYLKESLVIGGKWAVEIQDELLYIAPYTTEPIPKKDKERYRVARVPVKIRSYCYQNSIDIEDIICQRL